MDEKYCYPDSNVLKNKLGIRNPDAFSSAERKLSKLRALELEEHPLKGNFDLKHLQKIHRYLFQDLYSWAGKLRTADITKGNMFCKVQFLQGQADELFDTLRGENYLRGLSREALARRLAFYFSEINALHPFRDGNGRAQREFIRELALYNGHKLLFAGVSEEQMLGASFGTFLRSYEKMERLFAKCLK